MSDFKLISWDEWKTLLVTTAVPIAILPLHINEVEKRIGVELERYARDGLGYFKGGAFKYRQWSFTIFIPIEGAADLDEPGPTIEILGNEREPEALVRGVCEFLGVSRSELAWVSDHIAGPQYSVVRLDDNDNEYEMERFFDERAAQSYALEFERRGHKQTYSVRAID